MESLRLIHVLFAAAAMSSVSAVNFTDKGCFHPGYPDELISLAFSSDNNRVSMCVDTCAYLNYTVAGPFNGRYCYCGNTYIHYTAATAAGCNVACTGNSQEKCGGDDTSILSSIYEIHLTGKDAVSLAPVKSNYKGCYVEWSSTVFADDLPFHAYTSRFNSLSLCTWTCARFNYTVAGLLEEDCYCGNSFGRFGQAPSDSHCSSPCPKGTGMCGAHTDPFYYHSVYAITSRYKGCFNRGNLDQLSSWIYDSDSNNSVSLCSDACAFLNYTVAALQWGTYCYCGNTYGSYNATSETDCNITCSGNSQERCGGKSPSYITSVYLTGNDTTNLAPVKYSYKGCYFQKNSTTGVYDLPLYAYNGGATSVSLCSWMCARFNYSSAGLTHGFCYCGNSFGRFGQAPSESSCNETCPKGPGMCGRYNSAMSYTSVYQVNVAAPDGSWAARDGSWSTWSSWTACNTSCGTGGQRRNRSCSNPAQVNGGFDCPAADASSQQQSCNLTACPVNGSWSVWSSWTACSASGGGGVGVQRRNRSCTNPAPANGGFNCSGADAGYEQQSCNSTSYSDVPVSAHWTAQPSRLQNRTLERSNAPSVVACVLMCRRKAGCLSVNFIDASLQGGNCELNNQTLASSNPSSADVGWHNYSPHQ